jgi:hypothetical protein
LKMAMSLATDKGFQFTFNMNLMPLHINWAKGQLKKMCTQHLWYEQ